MGEIDVDTLDLKVRPKTGLSRSIASIVGWLSHGCRKNFREPYRKPSTELLFQKNCPNKSNFSKVAIYHTTTP